VERHNNAESALGPDWDAADTRTCSFLRTTSRKKHPGLRSRKYAMSHVELRHVLSQIERGAEDFELKGAVTKLACASDWMT